MTGPRLYIAAGITLLVVGGVAVGVAVSRLGEEPVECWAVADAERALGPGPLTSGSPTITALGDSFSLGVGVSGPQEAWPAVLGGQLGAEVVVDGVGATGLTTRGFCPESPITYGERVDRDPPEGEVVVLQGSVNDATGGDPDEVGEAARDLLADLEDVPTVVVVGVPVIPAAELAALRTIDEALRAAAADAGRAYVPLLDEDIEILPDRVHPTVEGQQRIGELVAAAVEAGGAPG